MLLFSYNKFHKKLRILRFIRIQNTFHSYRAKDWMALCLNVLSRKILLIKKTFFPYKWVFSHTNATPRISSITLRTSVSLHTVPQNAPKVPQTYNLRTTHMYIQSPNNKPPFICQCKCPMAHGSLDISVVPAVMQPSNGA